MRKLALLASVLALMTAGGARAQTFSFDTLDNPADPTFNQLLGINDQGVISGYFGSGNAGHPNKGYTIAPPYAKFLPDNLPDSAQTQATGINNAKFTTGFWSPTNLGPPMDANYGFIRIINHGVYEYLSVNDPLANSSPLVSQVLGINKLMNSVGFYNDSNNVSHGFEYSVSTGRFTPVNVGGAASVVATGINDNNLISGFFVGGKSGLTFAFLQPLTGGTTIRFPVPHASVTQFFGVNNSGIAVGSFIDAQKATHGLYFNPATFAWTQVDAPGAANGTVLNGLNNKNQIVGFYTDAANNTHGLLVTVTP